MPRPTSVAHRASYVVDIEGKAASDPSPSNTEVKNEWR